MKERALVSKGQHTVQGSELAAFLAVQSSGWKITERQRIIITTIFHLSLSLCDLICHILLPPETGIRTCPTEILPGNNATRDFPSLNCGDPQHHGTNSSSLKSKGLFPWGYKTCSHLPSAICPCSHSLPSQVIKQCMDHHYQTPKTVKKLLYNSYSSL